jgi:peptidoglycan/xylan/chitin deacetylase (PgdA/CDA1 family)
MQKVGRIRTIFALVAATVGLALASGGAAGAAVAQPAAPAATATTQSTTAAVQSATQASPASQTSTLTTSVGSSATTTASSSSGKTIVTFAWGGGNASAMPGLSLFKQYGMHATYYVPSGLVCFPSKTVNCAKSQYLTLSDMHQIAADGNEIGGLTVNHLPLASMSTAEATREICNDRANLAHWGFPVTDFAYPFAVSKTSAESLVRKCGYNSGLGAGQVAGAGVCEQCGLYAETVPPKDPMLIRAPVEVNTSTVHWTPGTFESIVRSAQAHGGGWVVFLIHDICPSYCQYGITKPQLQQVLSWMHSNTGPDLSVETVHQVVGGAVKPLVAAPAPTKIGKAGVRNAALTSSSSGQPACFETADYGSNSTKFSYNGYSGPGGTGAETVSMTSASSGDAKLLQNTDLGQCAPPAKPGRTYVLGASYKSSVPTQFEVYYRNQAGAWAYWTSGTRYGASSTWKHVTWTTPATPPGTTAISFGLAINQRGAVTTSSYSLAKSSMSTGLLLILALIALLLVAPFLGWKLWHPRTAAGAASSPRSSGTAAKPEVGDPVPAMATGRKWMAGPPKHQLVIDGGQPAGAEPTRLDKAVVAANATAEPTRVDRALTPADRASAPAGREPVSRREQREDRVPAPRPPRATPRDIWGNIPDAVPPSGPRERRDGVPSPRPPIRRITGPQARPVSAPPTRADRRQGPAVPPTPAPAAKSEAAPPAPPAPPARPAPPGRPVFAPPTRPDRIQPPAVPPAPAPAAKSEAAPPASPASPAPPATPAPSGRPVFAPPTRPDRIQPPAVPPKPAPVPMPAPASAVRPEVPLPAQTVASAAPPKPDAAPKPAAVPESAAAPVPMPAPASTAQLEVPLPAQTVAPATPAKPAAAPEPAAVPEPAAAPEPAGPPAVPPMPSETPAAPSKPATAPAPRTEAQPTATPQTQDEGKPPAPPEPVKATEATEPTEATGTESAQNTESATDGVAPEVG